ncbi:hypothetical protein E1B28_004220 [Marasmius oreades]|uniref:Uncharacterized protein n=1 Tax=Marasmius oreades TaxID=181124 RepID=A0A9P7UY56_9AGAR|nr:uncharacterized protein E1B28_004220 [Marasmius oreades]KAG7096812.1 hypothetical protein E1B28_004220 [Marasmius oreades]
MHLPATRELELEILLREKEKQISELGDQVTRLQQFLPSATPSTSDPVTLPPALIALLLPHINNNAPSGSGGTTMAALMQRVRLLQEENDQLYDILKEGETGQLKEEVQTLRRLVVKLESTLKESHQTISNLSTELDKSYDAFAAHNTVNTHKSTPSTSSPSYSHRNFHHHNNPHHNGTGIGTGSHANRLPPTGPRAHKKPRLSENHKKSSSRSPRQAAVKNLSIQATGSTSGSGQRHRSRSSSSRTSHVNHINHSMEVDGHEYSRPRSPIHSRKGGGGGGGRRGDKERERDRAGEREPHRGDQEKDRDRDRNRSRRDSRNQRRSGGPGSSTMNNSGGVDRTLAERMGLSS